MKGFVVGHGGSGTTWAAHALRECCGLDARHESMGKEVGEGFGGVESNGNLWRNIPEIRGRFPGAAVVHLVRDGRRVVETVLHRKPDRAVEQACKTWVRWNERMLAEADVMFRLEDLVADFDVFSRFAQLFGGTADREGWEQARQDRQNASEPRPSPLTPEQESTFWRLCGDTMRTCGYSADIRSVWREGDTRVPYNEQRARYYQAKVDIARRLQPARIVEIGVRCGYSAWSFLQAIPDARYDGFDNLDPSYPNISDDLRHAESILRPYNAHLHLLDTQEALHLDGKWDMAHVDGDHSFGGCLHDIGLVVDAGCRWVVVDDLHMPEVRGGIQEAAGIYDLTFKDLGEPYRGMALLTV